jgi:hypothetical protein
VPDDDPEGVLSPEELEIAADERVRRLDDERYVVETDRTAAADADVPLALPEGAYAVAARARAESTVDGFRIDSDDVAASFEALVRWYAGLVAPEEQTERVVATLLDHADLEQ